MARSPQEVFDAHRVAVGQRDVSAILQDYRDDCVLITPQGPLLGLAGVEVFFSQALRMLPELELNITSAVYEGDGLLARWTASSPTGRISDGVDTFVFLDGAIRLQTSVFTVELL